MTTSRPAVPAPTWALALALAAPVASLGLVATMVATDPSSRQPLVAGSVVLAVLVPAAVGFLVLRHDGRHAIGWLLVAHSLLLGVGMATPPRPMDSPSVEVVAQLSIGWWVLLYLSMVLIAYVFPTGHFRNARWRRWVLICLAGYGAFIVGATDDVDMYQDFYPGRELPIPTPSVLFDALGAVGLVLVAASLVGTLFCLRLRLKDATGDERLQLLWFGWAALSIPGALAVCWLDAALTGGANSLTVLAISAMGCLIPIVIGVAILRTRLFDIELVLSRTLTYATLTVGVVGIYALALWTTDALIDRDSAGGLIAVGIVAVVVQPAHSWLRRRVERMVYGDRNDPGLALRRLADRVEGATDPASVVSSVTGSVVDALRVERAWVERDGVPDLRDDDRVVRVPLVHRSERLGDLAVLVPRGRTLSTADLALLHDLARHAAVVVQAAALAGDLQASRARLVTAREEERRRLRRDLHDGLGPSLAAIVLKLNAAQSRHDEADRADLIGQTLQEATAAIAEVRRLVDDLRPPAIDEVGLLGAIRQRAASLAQGSELEVEVAGPASLPLLPAAVEVAAFRIASEAMTNVARHSGATRCVVRIAVNGGFELTVSDNGHGAPAGTSSGVGWTSMAERAEELGGTCTVSTRAGGGLVVRAVLPLSEAESQADVPAVQP